MLSWIASVMLALPEAMPRSMARPEPEPALHQDVEALVVDADLHHAGPGEGETIQRNGFCELPRPGDEFDVERRQRNVTPISTAMSVICPVPSGRLGSANSLRTVRWPCEKPTLQSGAAPPGRNRATCWMLAEDDLQHSRMPS